MWKKLLAVLMMSACVLAAYDADAHFGMVIPSKSSVASNKDATVKLDLKFWHPFENTGMDLARPKSFQVYFEGKGVDLAPALAGKKERGHAVWSAEYTMKKPGLYAFVMEPQPYYEKEEDSFILHITKVYVDAFGKDEGWDKPLGLKAEIVPMMKPGAVYAGNLIQGVIVRDGKPEPGAEVEVEWYPGPGLQGNAPHVGMVTQTVKADSAGVFSYVAPAPGWWGFAALKTADYKLKHEGVDKPVEEGAVLWIYCHPMKAAAPVKK